MIPTTPGILATLAAKRSASRESPGWRRMAPYPGYAVVPLFCRVALRLPGLQRLPAIWRSIRALRRPAQA